METISIYISDAKHKIKIAVDDLSVLTEMVEAINTAHASFVSKTQPSQVVIVTSHVYVAISWLDGDGFLKGA